MVDPSFLFVCFVIVFALAFDFTNGVHDAANSVATIVSTRVLTPRQAVVWAAAFNFLAFFIFGTAVAKTIGSGLVDPHIVTPVVIFAGLVGAVGWNLITWYLGLPTSSSHALIGGYAGAAIACAGWHAIILSGWYLTILFIVLAPIIGLILGVVLIILVSWILRRCPLGRINIWSRRFQLLSAALYSLGHGGNDAQKTIGIIMSLLFSAHLIHDMTVPLWLVTCSYTAIALGTMIGGWRIMRTMGQKIVKLRPIDGFCAETASATTLFLATYLGIPVSTTHTITGAISGVGAARRVSAVRWGITLRIVWAWVLTIPFAGLIAGGSYLMIHTIF